MPVCDSCRKSFDVETRPGALLFSHPESVKAACVVKKYHICQDCESEITARFGQVNNGAGQATSAEVSLTSGQVTDAVRATALFETAKALARHVNAPVHMTGFAKIMHATTVAEIEAGQEALRAELKACCVD